MQNRPLPAAPAAVPMAEAQTGEHFAAATEADNEDFATRSHEVSVATDEDLSQVRSVHAVAYRVSVDSDEARILRERAAWLKSLDRK